MNQEEKDFILEQIRCIGSRIIALETMIRDEPTKKAQEAKE